MKKPCSIKYRSCQDIIYRVLVCTLVGLAMLPFFWILGEFLIKGLQNINIELFYRSLSDPIRSQLAIESGDSNLGGIANGLYGSVFVILIALLIAVPLGLGLGLFLFGMERKSFIVTAVYYACTILRGLPPIIIGVVVYIWIVAPMGSFSALAGGVALAFMIFPDVAYTTYLAFRTIPQSMKETAFSLTGNRQAVIFLIFFPLLSKKILSSILFSTSRALGETAPILFTALGASYINWNLLEPTSTLPLLIWNFFEKPGLDGLLWSASFFLLLLCFLLSMWGKKLQSSTKTIPHDDR